MHGGRAAGGPGVAIDGGPQRNRPALATSRDPQTRPSGTAVGKVYDGVGSFTHCPVVSCPPSLEMAAIVPAISS